MTDTLTPAQIARAEREDTRRAAVATPAGVLGLDPNVPLTPAQQALANG